MANRKTLISDLLGFLKELINLNIVDPVSLRGKNSKFVMTAFGQRPVEYPFITLQTLNYSGVRAGMQSTTMDIELTIEIRVWSKSVTQSDKLTQQILDLLPNSQFIVDGSVSNDFHDFTLGSSVRIDEPGKQGDKSRVTQLNYKFYNI